jgi:hypothetical protein
MYICVYIHIHTNTCPFFLPFRTGQNYILSHFICFRKLKKKSTRSTTLTWFWGSAENISIEPRLLKVFNTILTSNIRISKAACKGRCISFGPRLTKNESHYVSSTPNLYQIVPDCSSVYWMNEPTSWKMFISSARRTFELVIILHNHKYILKCWGPNTEAWRTPERNLKGA